MTHSVRRAVRRVLPAFALAPALVLAACSQGGNEVDVDVTGTSGAEASAEPTADGFSVDGVPDVVATVASGLAVPWGIDFLPDGRAVVTERDSARVLLVTPPEAGSDDEGEVVEAGVVEAAAPRGEAGLLGVAVSPGFEYDRLVYLYVSTDDDNRVVRATLEDDRLGTPEPVLTGIPAGTNHDGGRLAFGPDRYLYVTTGEAGDPPLAQDRDSLGGKVLRIAPDGSAAPDNPFGTAVLSWGHRNIEGIAFDPDGNLWASEFGDKSADELNLITPGGNYGWPMVEGDAGPARFERPQLTWPTDDASPGGIAHAGGYLWMAGLRGERLWRIKVADGEASDPADYFEGEYGRLRTVVTAPDGRLWLTTSNQDGRGTPAEADDRILLIEP